MIFALQVGANLVGVGLVFLAIRLSGRRRPSWLFPGPLLPRLAIVILGVLLYLLWTKL